MPDENTTGIQEPSTPAEATTKPTITGERMPGFGIDYQAPTIVAPDLVVNVPEITLPDRINTSKSPPEKNLPPVNDVLLPTVTPDWFGLRSQSAKTAITHPVLSDIVRRGDKSFEDKTLAINNFDAAVAEDIASKPELSRNKDAATRKLDADVLIAKSELLNNRMAARRKELFPTYEEQNAFAKAVATGGDNPDAYTDPKHRSYVEEHNKLVKDLIGPGTRSWEAKATDPGGHEVAQYTVKPTASGDAIAFIKTRGALKPAEDISPLAAILTGIPADQVANPQEDKGWDTHSDVIRFKMPTKEDQFAEQYKTTKRLDELKGEIEAAKNKIEQFSKKPEPTFGSILARATVGFGGGGAPGIDTASAAVMSNQQLLDSLTAEQKNLTKRMSDLTKDGIRVLANERVAEAIKADPKLMSQIPDKGRIEQLITGFRNQAVQMNVLLEQMGVPGYAGSLDAAAELARLDAINGTGGEQSKFRGTLVDELTNITVDSAPGMLMAALTTKGVGGLLSKSLAEAGGLAAGRAQMMGTTYSQSLVSAELTARGMEDAGDYEGAQKFRDTMQAGSLFNGVMEGVGESIFQGDELALLKRWKGSFGKQAARAISSAAQNTIEGGVTQIGQNWTNPYTSGQPDPGAFSRDTAMAMAADGVGGFIHQVALAPFNQEKTREENIAAAQRQLEERAKSIGVNIHETPPDQVDIHSELVTSPADGKTQVQNMRQMIAPSGDQKNWIMGDESWRQRAFQAGVKSEFTSEEEARQFAATAQQQIVTAEFRNSMKGTNVDPDLVEPMLNWIGLTIKQQAIANKQDTNTTWARYGYAHQAEILREAEQAVTGTSSNPSVGANTTPSVSAGMKAAQAQVPDGKTSGSRVTDIAKSREFSDLGGWKLHLSVPTKNYKAVDEWLHANHKGQYKLLSGGSPEEGSDFTIYIGSKDDASSFAEKIQSEIGDLVNNFDGGAAKDAKFNDKVGGRFDVSRTGTNEEVPWIYAGAMGIPLDEHSANQINFNGDRPKNSQEYLAKAKPFLDRIDKQLAAKYGDRYTGTKQPSPETSPAPETKPPAQNGKEEEKGQTLLAPQNRSSPAVESAQAIENTLTGEERIRQSAVGGKLLADRLRAQEQAAAESPDMRAAWEKRRAHALAMQDQEPAYVSDAQGHPAVTTVLTALDAYDAASTDEEKLQVLDDVKPATVAAAERIAENTIAKIEADESLNDEEKKAMSEKWWKFAEDIKAIRVAAPESSFVKQEAPVPATADQTAASTEAVNASHESSPTAQAPEASPSAPVGTPSITATTDNATPAPPTQEAKLQAGRKAIKEQDAKREAIKGKQPNVGDNVNFKEEGTTYTGKYLGPSKDAGFSRVDVEGKVFEPPNSNVAKYTPGVTLFQKIGRQVVTPAQDAEYMAAVESGDTAKQQALVDEAAKAGGYDVKAYHGTIAEDFTEFRHGRVRLGQIWGRGFYLTEDQKDAEQWAEKASRKSGWGNGRVISARIKINKPLVLDGEGSIQSIGEMLPPEFINQAQPLIERDAETDLLDILSGDRYLESFEWEKPARLIGEYAQELGYDGIIGTYENTTHFVVFDPNQIKSADPVTRDSEGNVIPLSKRFNPESNSILYQSGQDQEKEIRGKTDIFGQRTATQGTLGSVKITFSSKANASTVMHEQIHALGLLESPRADGGTISALESILGKDKSKALYSWAMQGTEGMSPVDAFTRTHERIAEGFDKWLTEGRLPKGKGYLAGVFNSIRVAMRNIVNGMINPDSRFSYIDPKAALPQGVQEAYQQLFSMLENKPVTQSDKPLSVFDSMVNAANASMNALYPFTIAGEAGRTAMTAKQIADHFAIPADDPERENDPRVVASLAEATVNAQRANAGFTLFQMQGPDKLPNEKAKELIDVALPTVISAQEDGGKGLAGWLQYLKKINSPILNELTPGAREALYQATLLNIPSYEALAAQERIDAAIAAATNNEEVSEADFSRAIESVIPSLSPNIASLVKRIAGNTITGVDRKNALTAVMRAVRVDARSKFNTASNNLTQLLRGYRAGSKNSSHIKDIISEINKVIRPLLNSKEIGKNTKKTIEQTMLFVDFATHGRPEIADIVTMMQRNINSIREDLARNAQAAFIKGARAGGKYENAQFAARQEALIKTIEAELKTVSGMTPARISQVMKTLRGAKSDKALSKATWKALLLFQDQRVRDAYAEVEARQERIKANMKAGKFGELNYLVAEFNNYDPDSIPQHMLAQYSDLARKLSGSEPVILLAGVKNQIEDINDQLDAWLEANPFESKVRAETLRDGFDEAMQRLSALEEFDAAKAARSRDSFITKQQEMGKDLRRAEMAARMIDEHGVFQAFEEADEDELADFSPRQITGLANSFRNYNEGIVTPYLFKQSMALRSQRMQKVWMPMMQHGVRQFLYMKADTPLTEESADLRAGGIMKQLGRRLAGFGQYFGDKPTGKNIRAQFDSHDHLRYDALMGTFNWMNENVVIPMEQAQVAGLKLRNEIMHNKDASGRTMRDYQYIFQGTLEGHEIVKPFLDLTLFSNMVAGKKDIPFLSKLAHTQEAWREMWSRIAGIYMIQRQRESNDMPGTHYADFMANGAPSRKDSQAAINEERRQIAAIKAIRALLDATYQKRKEKAQGGMQKDSRAVDLTSMSAANIREILPPEVKSAIALADTNFGLTGEMTRLLNLFESEAPLPMPVNYFPIHGMDDNMSIKAKVDLLKGPMQDHGVPSTPRADARHARTDERLKFQNADFFGVHQDAVHAAAVDSAMTPFLKLVNMSMSGMMRQKEGEPPAFAGTAGNVVANLRDAMLEYGARYAHAVTTDPGVVRTLKGVALGLIYRMHLPQAFRPLQETLQNLTLLLGSTHAAAFKRGSAEFGKLGLGQDRFWDKVMIDLNAPTAARGTTEATIGLLHASMDDSLSALEGENAHIPGTIEAFFKDASQKPLAERGAVARLQSHRAAQVVKATSDLTVTVAEKAFTHQLWTGVFIKSLEDQTGHAFSRDKMDSYSPEQKQKALAAAELAVTEILAPSARGATRLKAQTPLDETTANIVLKNMVYALTSFTGAISTTAKMSVKAMVEGRAGLMDRTDGARNIAAIVGSGVVGSAISAAILAGVPGLIAGAMAKLHPDDDDDPTNDAENTAKKLADSGAYQRLRKLYHGMWPFDNGVGNTGKFWFNRFMQAAFQSRFGGTDSISRLAAATGAEALNYLGVNLASRMGLGSPYDPYRDNFTQEGIPALTAGTLLVFGSEDPQLRRAFQNSNIMDMSRVLGPISAALAFGVAIKEDAQLISRGLHGEGNMAPAALDALVQIGLLTNTLPLYKTFMQSTKALKDMDSTDFKTYSGGIKDKDAKRLGIDLFYASPEAKPSIEAQLDALDDYHYGLAMKENLKLTSFKEAYTVPDDPSLSAILKSKLERIRDGSSSQLPERIVAAYIDLEKMSASVATKTGKDPHYEDELIRSIRYLMLPRKGWEGHFTVPASQGTPGAEILQAKEIELRKDGQTPVSDALHGMMKGMW